MQGAAAQAMSVHIVEPPQRRPRPTYAASGGRRRLGQTAPRPGRGRARGAVPRTRFRRNPEGAWVLLGSAIVRLARVARPRMLGSAIVRLARVARPRMRASLALLVVDDVHRHRLPPRALRTTECQDNHS